MNIIASNSTSYEQVVTGVIKKERVIERANYIWTEVMGRNGSECGSTKTVRGDKR